VPAIQTARLRQQSAMLAEHFSDPPAYVRSLHYLLDYYADRARRPGQSGRPAPLINAYQVHRPVLRIILQELVPLAQKDPEQGFALCDTLWNESYLEFRMLASMLIGQMPVVITDELIRRIHQWITADLDVQLLDVILMDGLIRLRKERPLVMINLIQDWLNLSDNFYRQLGLRALLPAISDPGFENLPIFFRMIQPFMGNTPSGLRPDLLEVLTALAHRSPQEAAYFLRQCLDAQSVTDTPWLIRQILSEFPTDIQVNLRQSVRRA
jgi:hypothetical protein